MEALGIAWGWLMSPISGSSHHFVSAGTAFHGRLMVLARGILVPVGILLSRFYKVTPGQDWPHRCSPRTRRGAIS